MVTISLAAHQFNQRTVFCELILNRHGCVCVFYRRTAVYSNGPRRDDPCVVAIG